MRRFLLALVLVTAACSRDPNILKKRYVDAGNKYFQSGKLQQASIMYRHALRKDSRYAEAYYRQAQLEIKRNQPAEAASAFRRAVELLPEGPERVDARTRLAGIYLLYLENVGRDRELLDETGRLAGEILARDAGSFDGHLIQGRAAALRAVELEEKYPSQAAREIQASIAELETADRLRPFQPAVVTPLARVLWAGGRPREAEQRLMAMIDRDKTVLLGYSELRRFYMAHRRLAEAEDILKRAIENNPSRHSLLVDLAAHYESQDRREEMVGVLDRLTARAAEFPPAYEVAGSFYLRIGDAAAAIRQYEAGLRAAPQQKSKYQNLIVDALLAENRQTDAAGLNDAILRERPADIDALIRRGVFLIDSGEVQKAAAELEDLLRRAPNHFAAHYHLGRALAMTGQRERARFHFSECLRRTPYYVPARIALAHIQIDTGEYGKAVESAAKILLADPQNATARVFRAIGLRGLHKTAEARAELLSLLASQPRNDVALYELGVLNASQSKWTEAEAAYRKSYDANPASPRGLMALVESHVARNQADQAIALLQAEIRKRPERADLRIALGDVATRAGRQDLAIAEFQLLLAKARDPKTVAELSVRLAESYRQMSILPAALDLLLRARQLSPGNAVILHNLAILYDTMGQRSQAREAYESSLKVNGDNGIALNNLAFYMAENGGDLDQALTYAQRARLKMPNQLEFADTVGWIYLKKNLSDEALDIFQSLVAKRPSEPVFRYHLGAALLKKGDKPRARKELETALAGRLSSEEAGKVRELLVRAGA